MSGSEQLRAVKRATVAVVVMDSRKLGKPFRTVGTGFCIHKDGIIVTCEHVQRSFLSRELHAKSVEAVGGRSTESVFEKGRLLHGHRLMSVAVAAMVMRVSATAVSCS